MARVTRKKKRKEEKQQFSFSAWYLTALYVRLSNEEMEQDETEKIKNQKALLLDYISNKPQYQLVDVYCDNGCTGTNFDRPQWQRLMGDVRAGKVNCIIVKDLSRLGRNYIEAGEYIEKIFPFLGVRFIAVSDSYDSDEAKTQNTDMAVPLKNIINASYAKDLSGKISSARHIQRSRGEFTGSCVPFGYQRDEKMKGKLVIEESAAAVVKMIFSLVATGHSYSETARILNSKQVPSPRGKLWNYQSIKIITCNEVYIGNMVQGKMCATGSDVVRVNQAHEAIIEKEVFEQVRRQREKISFKRSPKEKEEMYLFQGLLVAKNSQKILSRVHYTKQSGEVKAYRSPKTLNEKGEPYKMVMIREETLITTLRTIIFSYLEILNVMENFLKQENIRKFHQNRIKQVESALQGKRNGLDRRKNLLMDCYSDMAEGFIAPEDYKRYSETYRKDISRMEKEIKDEEKNLEIYQRTIALKNPYIAVLKDFGKNEKVTRELLELLVKKIVVISSKEVEVHFTFEDEFQRLQTIVKGEADGSEKNNSSVSSDFKERCRA